MITRPPLQPVVWFELTHSVDGERKTLRGPAMALALYAHRVASCSLFEFLMKDGVEIKQMGTVL